MYRDIAKAFENRYGVNVHIHQEENTGNIILLMYVGGVKDRHGRKIIEKWQFDDGPLKYECIHDNLLELYNELVHE